MLFYRFVSVYLITNLTRARSGTRAGVKAYDKAKIRKKVLLLLIKAFKAVLVSASFLVDKRFY